jgi:acyl-CoA reductase-like NAD-dependent aldehyde dehydrogenase
MPSPSDALLEVLESATAAVHESDPRADVDDVDAAVARGRLSVVAGGGADGPRRRAPGVSDAIREHLEELAVLEPRNAGKPIGDARGEMGMVADVFASYGGARERLLGDSIPVIGGPDDASAARFGEAGCRAGSKLAGERRRSA